MEKLPTLHQFLDNPMGHGSNALTSRKLVKDDLERRYLKLIETKKNLFKEKIYKNGNEYYFHILIPSESERENTYDVVIHFMLPEDNPEYAVNNNTLKDYRIKIFSNSPSFIYTYAYTVNEHGFLVDELSKKFKDIVLDQKPVIRNPYEIVSYEKTVTFAMFHIIYKSLLVKFNIDNVAHKYNKREFINSIREDDKILMEIKLAGNAVKKKKSKDNDKKAGIKNKLRTTVSQATKPKPSTSSKDGKPKLQPRAKRGPRAKR